MCYLGRWCIISTHIITNIIIVTIDIINIIIIIITIIIYLFIIIIIIIIITIITIIISSSISITIIIITIIIIIIIIIISTIIIIIRGKVRMDSIYNSLAPRCSRTRARRTAQCWGWGPCSWSTRPAASLGTRRSCRSPRSTWTVQVAKREVCSVKTSSNNLNRNKQGQVRSGQSV